MTGYRSKFFRHNCCDRGCYVEQLPAWDDLLEAFPRRIRPSDIDGMVEVNGNFLFLEEKCAGKGPDEGQRLAFRALSSIPRVTVVFFRPAFPGADDPLEVLTFPNPTGWQPITRDQFKHWLTQWAISADRDAA